VLGIRHGQLLSVLRNALILQRQRVPSAGFGHEFLKVATVADGPFHFLGQIVWHVYGKSAIMENRRSSLRPYNA
jgi:hypothetical protein